MEEAPEAELDSVSQAGGFDWGADCSAGDGEFAQYVPYYATETVGPIPPRKRNVRIALTSPEDVDIQLIDTLTGTQIIAWPGGLLNGATFACATYQGVQYCYSGYNGSGGELGNEFIEIRGDTNRQLTMRVFGYAAGSAAVEYSWEAAPTCNEAGAGSFSQYVPHLNTATVGEIPAGKVNVRIDLRSTRDVDVQLFDGSTPIVRWPDGLLNGPTAGTVSYAGMTVAYSGYNGDGTGRGNEYIEVRGRVTRKLTMRAFGYAAGNATVNYQWGVGAGAACGSLGLPACGTGLVCKNGDDGDIAIDVPGTCHTESWCESEASAPDDCAGLIHIAVPGYWGCDTFQCVYRTL